MIQDEIFLRRCFDLAHRKDLTTFLKLSNL